MQFKKKLPEKKKKTEPKTEEMFPAFFCIKDTIKLRKNAPTTLCMIFIPLVLED